MRWASIGIAVFNGMAALLLFAFSGAGRGETADREAPAPCAASASSTGGTCASCMSPADSSQPGASEESAAAGPSDERVEGTASEQAGDAEGVIDAIRGIRRDLGLDPLAGTLLEAAGEGAGDRQFLESLRGVVPQGGELASFNSPPLTADSTAPSPSSYVGVLRSAARQLAAAADDLEDTGEYHQADRLRLLADRLRREARTAHDGGADQ